MRCGPAPRAARDGLVVLVARVAEGEVVHGALAGGQHAQRAVQRVDHTHMEVSTLPATTEAGGRGRSMEPSGTMMRMGLRQPAFMGISWAIDQVRKT